MKWLFFLLITNISLAQIITQEQCSDTSITKTNPNISKNSQMKKFFSKPRNQDSIGWCYAFTAADMLSAELGVPLSAMHASIIYNERTARGLNKGSLATAKKFKNVLTGGMEDRAVEVIVKNGVICLENDLPFDRSYTTQTYDLINALESIKDAKVDQEKMCQTIEPKLLKSGLQVDVHKLTESLIKDNLNITLAKMAQEQCHGKMMKVPNFKVATKGCNKSDPNSVKQFLKSLNGLLENGKIVGLGYKLPYMSHATGSHASSIIGRRWKNGRCQYQVRNSWGNSCASYKKNVECDSFTGTFWMNDELLIESMFDISYIQN